MNYIATSKPQLLSIIRSLDYSEHNTVVIQRPTGNPTTYRLPAAADREVPKQIKISRNRWQAVMVNYSATAQAVVRRASMLKAASKLRVSDFK